VTKRKAGRRKRIQSVVEKEAAQIADLTIKELAQIVQQTIQDERRSGGMIQFEAGLIVEGLAEQEAELATGPVEINDDTTALTANRIAEQTDKEAGAIVRNERIDTEALAGPNPPQATVF